MTDMLLGLYFRLCAQAFAILTLCGTVAAQLPSRAEQPRAIAGDPFGVVVVTVPLPANWHNGAARVLVSDVQGRVYYPVVSILNADVIEAAESPRGPRIGRPGGVIDRVRNAIQLGQRKQVPIAVQVHALFVGKSPLELVLSGDINQRIQIPVDAANSANLGNPLLAAWWNAFTNQATQSIANSLATSQLDYYLTDMLARRLNQPRSDPKTTAESDDTDSNQPLRTLQLLAGIEPLRQQCMQEILFNPPAPFSPQAVPASPKWQNALSNPPPEDVDIEPIANCIPPECFYLRFGSFQNYLWFQDVSERFGGDISQAVSLRGFNYESTKRVERTLATKLSTVAKLFGDKLIEDMALFGSDLYMDEGASLAVVFRATNLGLLKTAIEFDRKSVADRTPDARLQQIQIDGASVTLLSTPDNRIRSYLLADGENLVVSTSRHLIHRYLQVSQDRVSLAQSDHFRWARSWMPKANNYAVFAYLSPDFFHQLVSPQYQIELRRRLIARASLEIAETASLAAASEGFAGADSIAALKQAGFLPAWFDQRADGSQCLRKGDQWVDGMRGARGAFLPIADVPLAEVSAEEAQEYSRIAEYYQREWQYMDPILLGIRRFESDQKGQEKVVFEAHVAPFDAGKYGWIFDQLAAPSPLQIQQPVDDHITMQVHLRGESANQSYFLFGGVKDMTPPESEQLDGLIRIFRTLKGVPGYLGAWPKPDLVELLPLGLGKALARADVNGFSRMLGGLWRWQDSQWSLLSFDRSILEGTIRHLRVVESTDQAQVRAEVKNFQGTRLADRINRQWWQRGWSASYDNARLLDHLQQQFKVPAEQAMLVANRILDVKLQCPLAGQYVLSGSDTENSTPIWKSTAWGSSIGYPSAGDPPPEYMAPWIAWFRGGKAQAVQLQSSLSILGLIQLELPPLPEIAAREKTSAVNSGNNSDKPQEDQDASASTTQESSSSLQKLGFDVFSLPMKMFGDKN